MITTDALNMAGVTIGHTNAQIAVQAIQAGCDQLLMPVSVPGAYQTLLAAVRGGQISAARLDAWVRRIVALKLARGLMTGPAAASATRRNQHTAADSAVAGHIADRSVTMVKNAVVNGRRVLPLARSGVYVAGPAAPALRAALTTAGGRVVAGPGTADVIVVATQDAVSDPAQRRLVASLQATRSPVVVVATGVPYDLGLFPGAAAGLAAYSAAAASLNAAAQVLTGRISPAGRLPVAVPRAGGGLAYRYGTGLRY